MVKTAMKYFNSREKRYLFQHLIWDHTFCFVKRFFKCTRNGNELEWRRQSMWKIFNGELAKKEKHKEKRKHKKREETENGAAR
jgi:hypothetical protein